MKGRTLALQLLRTHLNSSTRRLSTKMERRMCAKTEQRPMNFVDRYVEEQLMRAEQIKESAQPRTRMVDKLYRAIIGPQLVFLGIGMLVGAAGFWYPRVRVLKELKIEMAKANYRRLVDAKKKEEEREKEAAKKKIEEERKQKGAWWRLWKN